MKNFNNMKNFKIFLFLLSVIGIFGACNKDEVQAVLNPGAAPTLSFSKTAIVLNKDNAALDAVTANWTKPSYGYDAAVNYVLSFKKKGAADSTAAKVDVGTVVSKSFTNAELNAILIGIGLEPEKAADVEAKVTSYIQGNKYPLVSASAGFNATPYTTKVDLTTTWGVVGSATPNGWNGPDIPFYKTDKLNVLKAYATLTAGEIKFREDNKWDNNLGDNGADGTLEKDGANIAVVAGIYVITFDVSNKTYTIDKLSWGIVGSAAPNGWNGPDVAMTYNPYNDTWNAIASLGDGEIKFRLNNDWGNNFGDDGNNGSLEAGGANIAVTKGTYLIQVSITNKTYTIKDQKLWGIVGSATPNGWNGPDTKFNFNFITEIWELDNMALVAGEIKFRLGDDWGKNYGDNGNDGSLEEGGANIPVTAGTYDFKMDLKDAAKPTYTITKK